MEAFWWQYECWCFTWENMKNGNSGKRGGQFAVCASNLCIFVCSGRAKRERGPLLTYQLSRTSWQKSFNNFLQFPMGHLRCDVILLRLTQYFASCFPQTLNKKNCTDIKHENCLLEPLDPIKRQQRSLNAKFPVSLACPVSRFLCERRCWLRVVLSLLFIDCQILGWSTFGKTEGEWWSAIPSISWDVSKRPFSYFPG